MRRCCESGRTRAFAGQFKSIQAAVDAAKPDDWILVGPGRLQGAFRADAAGRQLTDRPAGVLITKAATAPARDEPQHRVVDGTKPGSRDVQQQGLGDQEFGPRLEAGNAARSQRDHGVEGAQRLGPEPDRLQLPARLRRHRQRDLVERWRRQWQGRRLSGYLRLLPERHEHVLQGRGHRCPVRDLLEQLERRHLGATRTRATSTTRATTSAPAGSSATRSSTTRSRSTACSGTRARTRAATSSSRTRSSTTTRTASTPTARTATTRPPQNGACPDSGDQPDHPHALVLGVHEQLRPRQQQPERPRAPGRRRPVRSAPACRSPAAATTRSCTTASSTTARGASSSCRSPDSGPPCTGGTQNTPLGAAACSTTGATPILNNTFGEQRVLRPPEQRRVRAAQPRERASDRLLSRQHRDRRRRAQGRPAGLAGGAPDVHARRRPAGTPATRSSSHEVLCDSQVELGGSRRPARAGSTRARRKMVMHSLPTKQLKSMPNPCAGVPKNPWCTGRKA